MSGRVAIPAVSAATHHETTISWWMPYLLQWVAAVLSLPVAALAHAMWGGDSAGLPWVTVAMTLTGGLMALATYRITAVKRFLQIHATASVAVGMLWLTAATITGPFTHPLIDLWLLGAPAMAASWSVRRMIGRQAPKTGEGGGDSQLFKAVKLAGAKVAGEIEVGPNRATAQLQLPPGQFTADDVQQAKGRFASALSVGSTAVRVAPDPEHHDRATLTVVPQDMLKGAVTFPGPSAPGGSISEPLNVGIYEDGVHADLWLPGDKATLRNATHVLVMGMNGSGKSHGAKLAWTEILSRVDVKLWLADGAKGLQTIGAFAPYADWVAPSAAEAHEMLAILPSVIEKRAAWLQSEHGLDQWVPGCGMPYLVVWVEEAAKVVREDDDITDIVQTARSAGITIVLSLQRPSYTQIPVDVRNQMGAVWCFGVKESADAAFALDEALLDAGADPAAWKNRKPGYSYLEAPGIDDDRMVSAMRTWATTDADMVDYIREYAPYQPALDATTTTAAGSAYATRKRYTLDQHGKPVVVPAGSAPNPAVNSDNTDVDPVRPTNTEGSAVAELLAEAAELVITAQFGSTSMIQRKLRVNHADATELMRHLEAHDIVGPQPEDLDRARPVLIPPAGLDAVLDAIGHIDMDEDDQPPQPVRPGIHGRLTAADETDDAMRVPDNPDPDLAHVDPDTELPDIEPGENFAFPGSRPTPAAADAALAARLAELRAAGATTVGPRDIGKDFFDTVRSRPWVSARMAALAIAGHLIETDREGVYLFPETPADDAPTSPPEVADPAA